MKNLKKLLAIASLLTVAFAADVRAITEEERAALAKQAAKSSPFFELVNPKQASTLAKQASALATQAKNLAQKARVLARQKQQERELAYWKFRQLAKPTTAHLAWIDQCKASEVQRIPDLDDRKYWDTNDYEQYARLTGTTQQPTGY